MNKKINIFLVILIVLTTSVSAGFLSTTVRYNPSGWEDNGSLTRTLTDNPVNISGNVSIGGGFDNGGIDLTTLGDISLAGDILIQGDILTIVDQEINGSFLPTEDNKFDLGSLIKRWKDGFFSNAITALTFTGNNSQWSRDSGNVFLTTSTDNVGIGTASPQELLHVGAGTDASDITATELLVTRAGPSSFSVRDSTNGVEAFVFVSSVGGIMGTVTNDPLNIQTNNINAISIDTSQNVGIGITDPTSKLHVIGTANITDVLFVNNLEIKMGNVGTFTGLDNAVVIDNLVLHETGSIAFALVDESDGKIMRTWQVGLQDAGGFMRNSQIISSDFGIMNGSRLSRCSEMAEQMGGSDGLDLDGVGCNTTSLGASLLLEGSQRIGHRLVVGGGNKSTYGIQVQGFASFNLEGNNFDIFNGSIHPFTPRIEEIGFATGQLVTMIDEDFEDNDISPFQKREQVGSDLNNWDADEDLDFCFDNLCARARGGDGRHPRIMEHNITTTDRNKLNISFHIGARQIDTTDNLSVVIIEGTNTVMVFNFTGTGAASNLDISPPELITVQIPSSFDDKNKISIRINMSADRGGTGVTREEFWIDNILLVGTATASTRQNVTRRDTVILLGDGNQRIFWNDSSKVLELPANASIISETIQDLIISGSLTLGSVQISQFDDLKFLTNNSDANFTGVNVQGLVNATNLNGTLDCTMIGGGSDTDFCIDAEGSGGTSVWNSSSKAVTLNDSTLDLNLSGNLWMGKSNFDTNAKIFVPRTAAPAYSFFDDQDTGMAVNGADILDFFAGGAIIMQLREAGATSKQILAAFRGTTTVPSFSYSGDRNTGMWFPSANDKLELVAGGRSMIFIINDAFDSEIIINNEGVDNNFIVETNNEANMFFIDGGNDRIGIGTNTPAFPLDVQLNVSGISIFATGNISATDFITRTSVYDKNKGTALSYIKDSDDLLTVGQIDHSKFYGYVTYDKMDLSRPVFTLMNYTEYNESSKKNVTIFYNETSYPYTIKESGVSLGKEISMLRQSIYELKTELCIYKAYTWC